MNISEFRRTLKACFDRAANGEIIEIERGGLVFHLAKRDLGVITLTEESHIPAEALKKISPVATPPNVLMETTPPRIKTPDTPFRTEEEWKEAEALERKCCTLKQPCKHWHWVFERGLWVNELSHRERGEDE